MKTFLFEYEWDGDTYCMEVEAEDNIQALHRVFAMADARMMGEIAEKIPARGSRPTLVER